MSRVGQKPVVLPKGVSVTIEGAAVRIKGPKGELTQVVRSEIRVRTEDDRIIVERSSDAPMHRALHGLTRALLANMVEGVTRGYRKSLELVGVGYRADMKGKALSIAAGFSHPVSYPEPDGISLSTPAPTQIVVEGIDKQKVGQVAAEIRSIRPPEPYKGKGIRYTGEQVRRKAGKTGAK